MHLSCTDTNTISKRKEVRFHKTHVTLEFHRVHPKRCSCLWYIQRKPWTYLVSRLALSPNGPKQAFSWASSPSGTIECVKKWDFAWPTSPMSCIEGVQKKCQSPWYVRRRPCTYLALRLALSSKGPKWASTWASSPSGTIRCVQNDFWAYGTSSANHALILHRS